MSDRLWVPPTHETLIQSIILCLGRSRIAVVWPICQKVLIKGSKGVYGIESIYEHPVVGRNVTVWARQGLMLASIHCTS